MPGTCLSSCLTYFQSPPAACLTPALVILKPLCLNQSFYVSEKHETLDWCMSLGGTKDLATQLIPTPTPCFVFSVIYAFQASWLQMLENHSVITISAIFKLFVPFLILVTKTTKFLHKFGFLLKSVLKYSSIFNICPAHCSL